jgi:hypothetical protein
MKKMMLMKFIKKQEKKQAARSKPKFPLERGI